MGLDEMGWLSLFSGLLRVPLLLKNGRKIVRNFGYGKLPNVSLCENSSARRENATLPSAACCENWNSKRHWRCRVSLTSSICLCLRRWCGDHDNMMMIVVVRWLLLHLTSVEVSQVAWNHWAQLCTTLWVTRLTLSLSFYFHSCFGNLAALSSPQS